MITFRNNHHCLIHLFGVSGLKKTNQSSNVQFFAFAKNSTYTVSAAIKLSLCTPQL